MSTVLRRLQNPRTPRAPRRPLVVASALLTLASTAACAQGRAQADAREADRLASVLALQPGETVADVGAGKGGWSVALARRVGPAGRVYATEVKDSLLETIRRRAEEEGLENITPVLGDQENTGLPPGCCDALVLRKVYHHFTDPATMSAGMFRALKPGGRLAVIEYRSFLASRVEGVPETRSGHGIKPQLLIDELTAAGFELVEIHGEWMGDDNEYCALFRRPADS